MIVRWSLILAGCVWAGGLHAQTLHLAKQSRAEARLTGVDAQGHLRFDMAGQVESIALDQLVRWNSDRTVTPNSAVALLDGSWIAGRVDWLSNHSIRVTSKWFEPIELELDSVRALLLNASSSWPRTQQLQSQMLALTGSADVLWQRSGESASGILSIQTKKNLDDQALDRAIFAFKAQPSGAASEIDPATIAGMTFSPVLRRELSSVTNTARLTLVDGSRLRLSQFQMLSDNRLKCLLAGGLALTTLDDANTFTEGIAAVNAQPTGITWLGDLEPARYRLVDSNSKVPWPLGRDRDLFNKPLFDARGHAMEHALVMHAASQAAYRWDGKPTRFLAEVRILPQPSGGSAPAAWGSAKCQVLIGRNGQLINAWQSSTIRVGDAPTQVDVDVSNAQLVVLLVEPADQGTQGAHVIWRDPRLVNQ